MQALPDIDAILLLATTLASKRRPAELVEILAAAELIESDLPSETRLWESLGRLAARGLIEGQGDGGVGLTPAAQAMLAEQRKSADTAARLADLKAKLAAQAPERTPCTLGVTVAQVGAAILARRAFAQAGGKNLLVPKPKAPEGARQRPGQRQRKPLPARRRKD